MRQIKMVLSVLKWYGISQDLGIRTVTIALDPWISVMISEDHILLPLKLLPAFKTVLVILEHDVPENIDSVLRSNDAVPVTDDRIIHLLDGIKSSGLIYEISVMTEMKIGREIYHILIISCLRDSNRDPGTSALSRLKADRTVTHELDPGLYVLESHMCAFTF